MSANGPPSDSFESFQVGPTIHIWLDHEGVWRREDLWPDDETANRKERNQ